MLTCEKLMLNIFFTSSKKIELPFIILLANKILTNPFYCLLVLVKTTKMPNICNNELLKFNSYFLYYMDASFLKSIT